MFKITKPIFLFWLFSKCSNLNTPIMQTADQIKIENMDLVQGTVLAGNQPVLLCGVFALF